MLFRGQFKTIHDDLITVYIQTENSSEEVVTIGEKHCGDIFFDVDPIQIENDVDNSFEIFYMKTCAINLVIKHYLGDKLFTGNSRNIIVNVWKESECVFAGFAENNVYSQQYSKTYDKFTLDCTDALATFQYYNYMNLTDDDTYKNYRHKQGDATFSKIITDAFRDIPTLNLQTGQINNIYYDGSVRLEKDGQIDIFS